MRRRLRIGLVRGKDFITVETRPDCTLEEIEATDGKVLAYELEAILPALDEIEFGRYNWVHFIRNAKGGYRLVHKNTTLPSAKCPVWAPLVKESEIQVTRWLTPTTFEGYWGGEEVEVNVAWEEYNLMHIGYETTSHYHLRNLDVTIRFLAHIVRDGSIVGYMTEAQKGRELAMTDVEATFAALTKTLDHGFLYKWPHPRGFLVTDRGVVFVDMGAGVAPCGPGDWEAMGDEIKEAWDLTGDIFDELEAAEKRGRTIVMATEHYGPSLAFVVPTLPSIFRIILPDITQMAVFPILEWIGDQFDVTFLDGHSWRDSLSFVISEKDPSGNHRNRRMIAPPPRDSSTNHTLAPRHSESSDHRPVLKSAERPARSGKRTVKMLIQVHGTARPYRRPIGSGKVLLAPDALEEV
ncbi:hypothetical protein JAAARDRAFT_36751 [Jaapia argillacea MUCL 33604]|uniref:Aminoglycoside phosphotransferase domain-containing protein n=1 Tax=Jaapia argillacea MUCL 33604 TaxID=933084 RepID=A0A067PMF5_9AGAM|nr:hypothetical protein JAAARDRAFT_36751 [Jaapia argillacea MUCL 33604]